MNDEGSMYCEANVIFFLNAGTNEILISWALRLPSLV